MTSSIQSNNKIKLSIGPRSALGLQIFCHIASVTPLCWLCWAFFQDRLGGDPVQYITHFLGLGALRLLLLSLCITPCAKFFSAARLLKLRRPLGLWCFAWASLHFAVWISLDLQFFWSLIGEEIVERNYLLVGFGAWLILLSLALTSLPQLRRVMGRAWKKLHNWIYLVTILAVVHFLWAVKSGYIEPGIYILVALILLLLRKDVLLKYFVKKR
ncbi:protein-methionine-sulfoxide reductase heme-binding subunit MsrQ [Aurantivibrio infirmus]